MLELNGGEFLIGLRLNYVFQFNLRLSENTNGLQPTTDNNCSCKGPRTCRTPVEGLGVCFRAGSSVKYGNMGNAGAWELANVDHAQHQVSTPFCGIVPLYLELCRFD